MSLIDLCSFTAGKNQALPAALSAAWWARFAAAAAVAWADFAGSLKSAWFWVPSWRQLYKNRSSQKIDSQRLLSREYDFPKTFSLIENQFSGKTYFYTIYPWCRGWRGSPWERGRRWTRRARAQDSSEKWWKERMSEWILAKHLLESNSENAWNRN